MRRHGVAIKADLSALEGPEVLIRAGSGSGLGRIDILVHAAGVDLPAGAGDARHRTEGCFLDVHVTAAFLTAQQALPDMISRRWGRIVMVGSIWGEVGAAGEVAYSAAKAGLTGLTKALAKETALAGVTVNAVAPA